MMLVSSFQTNQHSPAVTKCQNVYMRAKGSTKQWFTDKLANLTVGDCAIYGFWRGFFCIMIL